MARAPHRPGGSTPGGCPCGFWSNWNCAYVRAVGICQAPRDQRPTRELRQDDTGEWVLSDPPPDTGPRSDV